MLRKTLAQLHRYSGLLIALFIIVVGVTGCILAFNTELERVFAPSLFAQGPHPSERLDLATLAEKASELVPHAQVLQVTYTEPDQASVYLLPRVDPATGKPFVLGFDEFYLNPWTGKELGHRTRGDLSEGLINVMPFIYRVHWTLALGNAGQWILGITALIWTLNALIGIYLTLPTAFPQFWRRWSLAWKIKSDAGVHRLTFDYHRAFGLWTWLLMLVFSWSAVMMNIRPVFDWVMTRATDYQPWTYQPSKPPCVPRLGWHEAQDVGLKLLRDAGKRLNFTFTEIQSLMYEPDSNTYYVMVRGSNDVFQRSPKGGGTDVVFDADTGALRQISQPTGEHAGNTIESWLYALHMARIGGRAYQILVTLFGLGAALLAASGAALWLRRLKRKTASPSRLR